MYWTETFLSHLDYLSFRDKVLAFMRSNGHVAYPVMKAPHETLESLTILIQRIIFKILSSGMWSHPGYHGPLTQLSGAMGKGLEVTWLMRRVFPESFAILCVVKGGLSALSFQEVQGIF